MPVQGSGFKDRIAKFLDSRFVEFRVLPSFGFSFNTSRFFIPCELPDFGLAGVWHFRDGPQG